MNKSIHNLLMMEKYFKPMFLYTKDGIVVNYGFFKGHNLTKDYEENSFQIDEMLDNLLDNTELTYKQRFIIKQIKNDLKNGSF